MRQIRVLKADGRKRRFAVPDALPLDPRDPGIVRAKQLRRADGVGSQRPRPAR